MSISGVSAWRSGDKFTPIYVLWFLVPELLVWTWWLFPTWDWWTIDFAIFIVLAPTILISVCVNLVRMRWRRLFSLLLAAFLVLFSNRILVMLDITPDRFRFELTKNSYLQEVQRIEVEPETPRFKTFPWDDTFVAKAYQTLVYDESDQIALAPGTQSISWLQQMERRCAEGKDCVHLTSAPPDEYISVTKLADHFYIVDDDFPNAFP
ncbi:hypothetical protein [Rhizobium sp. BR 362]|uniref:hypothetical protein n=1 Tax=Rhizobium sp. BR 362 TaxID=3040670 RepID=UPI002F4066A7